MMGEDEVTWPELEQQFGESEIGVIDHAIGVTLAQHENGIKREDFYLVSEGLTHAVLVALRDHNLRITRLLRSVG